jgi:ABC-2 type transport system ATP-binding protein
MDEAEHCDRLGLIYRGKLIALGTPDELKATYHGELLEVECEPLMEGLEALSQIPLVYDVALFGALLHVTVPNLQAAMPEIESAFKGANVKMLRVERIEPALEDVFVSLIEAQEQGSERVSG